MKRHGKLFNKIVDIENIRQAYKEAAKGKKKKKIVVWCESHLDEVCKNISEMLITKKYKTSRYRTMMIYRPKKREIYDLPFYPDRIVHHALMRVIEPIWEKLFIVNSYACIRGRGLHSGSTMTMSYVRKYKYCLKMDISKFYPSINHEVLYGIVEHKIKCPDTLWLLKEIIHSVPGGKNVPIGNYTSQWFGNLYLNELDQYLKHKHHVKAYVRYCDDFCIYHNDKKYLNQISKTIEGYLAEKLQLKMSKCDLFPVSRGVDFLGYRHFPNYVLLRKSTVKRMRRRLKNLPLQLESNRIDHNQYRSTIASISGWLKWANSRNLRRSLNIDQLQRMVICHEGVKTIQ